MASYLTFTVTFTLVLAAYDGTTSSMFTMLVMCHGPWMLYLHWQSLCLVWYVTHTDVFRPPSGQWHHGL